jgi:predicted transcriptional regulator
MVERPALSKRETEVARIVWTLGEATVRQVFEALPAKPKVDFNTVQTYLRRLERKGYLRARRRGRAMVYCPRVRPEQVIRETVDDLVNRLFDGQTIPLLHHLIRERAMGDEELRALREMVDQLEAEHDEPSDR